MKFFFVFLFLLASCQSQKKIEKSDDHHKIAIGLLKSCDKKRALSHLIKAVGYDSKNFILRHTLAVNYYSLAQYQAASKEFEKSLTLEPKLTEALIGLAKTYIKLKRFDEAEKALNKAQQDLTYTGQLQIIETFALLEYTRGKYLEAQKGFEEVLSIPRGKNCFNYIKLGQTQTYLGSLKLAEKNLKQAFVECKKIEKNPCAILDHEQYFAMAQLKIRQSDIKKASYFLKLFLKKTKYNKGDKAQINQAKKLLKEISSINYKNKKKNNNS